MPQHKCEGQRTGSGSWFSLFFTTWVPRTRLGYQVPSTPSSWPLIQDFVAAESVSHYVL